MESFIVKNPEIACSQLGYLPQEFGFYPFLSAHAVLMYLLKLKGVIADVSLDVLAEHLIASDGSGGRRLA